MGDVAFEVNPVSSDVPEWMKCMCNSFLNTKEAKRCYRQTTDDHPWSGYEPVVSLQVGFTAIFDKSIYFPLQSDGPTDGRDSEEENVLSDLLYIGPPRGALNTTRDVGPPRGALKKTRDVGQLLNRTGNISSPRSQSIARPTVQSSRLDVQGARRRLLQFVNQHADQTKSPPQNETFEAAGGSWVSDSNLEGSPGKDDFEPTMTSSPHWESGSSQSQSRSTQWQSGASLSQSRSPQGQLGSSPNQSRSPQRQSGSSQSQSISPQRQSGSSQSHSISPHRRSRSPQRHSRSPQRLSRSPQK